MRKRRVLIESSSEEEQSDSLSAGDRGTEGVPVSGTEESPDFAKYTGDFKLRKLVLENFKSFLGRQTIGPFAAGVTGICGVNGAGKSSVLEGIGFALGLSSAPTSAADVVAHGETSALARVELLIQEGNDDGEGFGIDNESSFILTVQHTVKLHATGPPTSTYKLARHEGAPLRNILRRDLRALLLQDIGLDINSPQRFAVHQATIGKLANQGANKLLELVEAVAGTTETKETIKETRLAQEQWKAEQSTLIADITALSDANDALAPQAKALERYNQQALSVEQLRNSATACELRFLSEQARHLDVRHAQARDLLIEKETRAKQERAAVQDLRAKIADLDKKCERMREKVKAAVQEQKTVRERAARHKVRLRLATEKLSNLQSTAGEQPKKQEKTRAILQREVQDLQGEYKAISQEIEEATGVLSENLRKLESVRHNVREAKDHNSPLWALVSEECKRAPNRVFGMMCSQITLSPTGTTLGRAVNAVLETTGFSRRVFVADRETGREFIENARKSRVGFVRCEILNEQIAIRLKKAYPPDVTPLNECLDYSKANAIGAVVRSRLASWVVVASKKVAEIVLRAKNGLSCVTLAGEIYTARGEFSNTSPEGQIDGQFALATEQKTPRFAKPQVESQQGHETPETELADIRARVLTERQRLAEGEAQRCTIRAKIEDREAQLLRIAPSQNRDSKVAARYKKSRDRDRADAVIKATDALDKTRKNGDCLAKKSEAATRTTKKLRAKLKPVEDSLSEVNKELISQHRRLTEVEMETKQASELVNKLSRRLTETKRRFRLLPSVTSDLDDAQVKEITGALENWKLGDSTEERKITAFILSMKSKVRAGQSALEALRGRVDINSLERLVHVQDDLRAAHERAEKVSKSLGEAAARLQKLAQTRYKRTAVVLRQAQIEFPKIFTRLTGGSSEGAVIFTDDIRGLFSDGITLHVRPDIRVNNSHWRPFSALSGGQQAIASLSLTIALHACVPSPLYIFDEIDASLDTHAVARVASWLQEQHAAANVQFIIVSLRPQLLLGLNQLLGVYHGASGSSKTILGTFPS